MERLYTSEMIGSMELKNRWIMLAMHTGYANSDGTFSRRDFEFYRRRSGGGMAAITLVGAVSEIGARHGMHRLDGEKYEEGLRKICGIIHKDDCKVIMQLYHAGRNNTDALHLGAPMAPSSVASPIYKVVPREMSEEDIRQTIKDFADAAVRCKKNGVDCIEISASVGYLLSEFLSPRTNLRADFWGGNDKKRMRFPTEILKSIRNVVGAEFPVIIKISGGDMLGGYDNDYMARFLNQLPPGTINGVTVTGGWHEAPVPQISYHVPPGGFSYLAGEIRRKTGLPVIACNRINSPQVAEEILQKGDCDFVGAARPFLADPDFINKSKKGIPYNRCQACNRGCIENALKKKDVCCVFNPETGREYLPEVQAANKKLLVVGAGPVGLEAAKTAGKRGYLVTIITDENHLGGKLHIVDKVPYKQMFSAFADYLEYEIRKNNVGVRTSTPVSEEIIKSENPDFIIFASGASPVMPEICKGSEMPCAAAEQILSGEVECTYQNIVIIGGGSVGLETAEFLGEKYKEKRITVVEMQPKAGKELGGLKWIMMKRLKELNVQIITAAKVSEINHNKVILELQGETTERKEIYADMVVYAVGYKPNGALGLESFLEKENIPYVKIGDAGRTRNLLEGVADAYITAENI